MTLFPRTGRKEATELARGLDLVSNRPSRWHKVSGTVLLLVNGGKKHDYYSTARTLKPGESVEVSTTKIMRTKAFHEKSQQIAKLSSSRYRLSPTVSSRRELLALVLERRGGGCKGI